jgi:uncharacterized membrane protein YcaP (DUF421 family)
MTQQGRKGNQQKTCRSNEQNWINNIDVATMNKSGSITDISQQQTKADQQQTCNLYCNNEQTCGNNEQKRINNKHATHTATTNKHAVTINRHAVTN